MRPKIWTIKQENFLRENYATLSLDELEKTLNIPIKKIQNKASKLGIRRRKQRRSGITRLNLHLEEKPVKPVKPKYNHLKGVQGHYMILKEAV